jgi:hypothetical protein
MTTLLSGISRRAAPCRAAMCRAAPRRAAPRRPLHAAHSLYHKARARAFETFYKILETIYKNLFDKHPDSV